MISFQQLSRSKVDKFLQSIIFIDDQAYDIPNQSGQSHPDARHQFDAKSISESFSKEGKICAVYKPNSDKDMVNLTKIAKNADVAIIDWQIYLNDQTESSEDDSEEDDEHEDFRGLYTKKIITELISEPNQQDSIKLIVVYTGDTDIEGIASNIHSDLQKSGISRFFIDDSDKCTLLSSSSKIMVIGKSNGGEERGKHHLPLREKLISYEQLPGFISDQFANMTSGLLTNFAMESLSEIRGSFNQILSLFSNDLDAAYLAHQSIIPDANDANELLVDILGEIFISIIRYKKLNLSIDKEVIQLWLKDNVKEEFKPILNKDGAPDGHEYNRSHDLLLELLRSNPEVEKKFMEAIKEVKQSSTGELKAVNKGQAKKLLKYHAISLFSDLPDPQLMNNRFANLCHHKQHFIDREYEPVLSLGTVVQSNINDKKYFVCIQQRCDSLRLEPSEDRRFLFISLSVEEGNGHFNFLTPGGIKLKIDNKTYDLRTVKFKGSNGQVVATEDDCGLGKKYFKPHNFSYLASEKFEFIVELKSLYAQQIADKFSSSLSRVGFDEAEWVLQHK